MFISLEYPDGFVIVSVSYIFSVAVSDCHCTDLLITNI